MKKNKIQMITIHAMATAILLVVTTLLPLPLPGGAGYLNLSDAIIFFMSAFFGPYSGMIVGALGGLLSDITTGYFVYAPFTFLIKGLEGLLAGFLFRKLPSKINFLAFFLSGIFMGACYFIPDWIFFKIASAIYNLPFNILQGLFSALIITVIVLIKSRMPSSKKATE